MIGPQIVETTSSVSSAAPLTLIASWWRSNRRGPSGVRYDSSSSPAGSTTTRSTQSPSLLVNPQATWPLLPTTIAGVPGSVTPVILCSPPGSSFVPHTNDARYHTCGTRSPRCMSSATIARPSAVWLPATAQLLLPGLK